MMATFETGDAWLLKRNWFNQTAITTGATTATADNNDNNNSDDGIKNHDGHDNGIET